MGQNLSPVSVYRLSLGSFQFVTSLFKALILLQKPLEMHRISKSVLYSVCLQLHSLLMHPLEDMKLSKDQTVMGEIALMRGIMGVTHHGIDLIYTYK